MNVNRKKSERGNAMLEFALSWSVMSLLFTGVFQYGYSFYSYNQLMSSVSGAAEIASKMQYDTGNPAAYTTAIQNLVLYGDETPKTSPLVPGLTASNVSVTVNMSNSFPTDVTVKIVNYQINSLFNTWTVNGKPRATVAYLGQVTCSTC